MIPKRFVISLAFLPLISCTSENMTTSTAGLTTLHGKHAITVLQAEG